MLGRVGNGSGAVVGPLLGRIGNGSGVVVGPLAFGGSNWLAVDDGNLGRRSLPGLGGGGSVASISTVCAGNGHGDLGRLALVATAVALVESGGEVLWNVALAMLGARAGFPDSVLSTAQAWSILARAREGSDVGGGGRRVGDGVGDGAGNTAGRSHIAETTGAVGNGGWQSDGGGRRSGADRVGDGGGDVLGGNTGGEHRQRDSGALHFEKRLISVSWM